MLDQSKLENLLIALADGSLKHADVFGDHGHGALVYETDEAQAEILRVSKTLRISNDGLVVTGPRRSMLRGSSLRPYFAVPFGDMMLAGCFGLLSATADVLPELGETIRASLRGESAGIAPWDI